MKNEVFRFVFRLFFKKSHLNKGSISLIFCNFAADLRVVCTHARRIQHNV